MKLPKSLTTVTPFSKTLAAILFITFPFAGFWAGMQYQKEIAPQTPTVNKSTQSPSVCKHWSTVCEPNSAGKNGVCAPTKVCADPSPTLNPTNQQPASPTCRPRPACLDATPRCMIPETQDMCPPSKQPVTIKACPMLAFKNQKGQTCTYSGPNCSVKCE